LRTKIITEILDIINCVTNERALFFNSRKQVLVKRLYAAKDFNYWQIMQEIFIDKKKKRMLILSETWQN